VEGGRVVVGGCGGWGGYGGAGNFFNAKIPTVL